MKFSDLCNYYRECLKKDEVSVALKSGCGLFLGGKGGLDEEIPLTDELEHFVLQYGVSRTRMKKVCRTPSPLESSGFGKPTPRQMAIVKNGRIPILHRVVKSFIVAKNL